MKLNKILAVMAVAGMATSVFGQGLFLNNVGNSGGSAATANGLVYINSGGVSVADLLNNDLGVEISAGLTSSSLSPLGLGTYTAATDPKGYTAWDLGQFVLGAFGPNVNVPGASAGSTAYIQMNMWWDGPYGVPDLFTSYANAVSGGGYTATVLFQQSLSGAGSPPSTPTGFIGMPSVILTAGVIPEPSTIALAGLGVASLLLFRRRK